MMTEWQILSWLDNPSNGVPLKPSKEVLETFREKIAEDLHL